MVRLFILGPSTLSVVRWVNRLSGISYSNAHVIGSPQRSMGTCQEIRGDGVGFFFGPWLGEIQKIVSISSNTVNTMGWGNSQHLLNHGWQPQGYRDSIFCRVKITGHGGNCQLCSMHFTVPLMYCRLGVNPWGRSMTCA